MSIDTSVYPNQFDTEKFFLPAVNNLKTKLASYAGSNQVTVINVDSTAGFPVEGVISIDSEVIYYRSIIGNSFRNITRGYDGTISTQHATGANVELRWIAAHHNRLKNAVKTVERTLGINPQGVYPDVASRLNSFFKTINKKTSQRLNTTSDVQTETGYINSGRAARMFLSPEVFTKVPNFSPIVYLDGIVQRQNDPVFRVQNIQLSIVVVDSSNKGSVTCSSALFLSSGIASGDIAYIKGSPTNNDAYIVDAVISNTEIRFTQTIFGSNQSSATGFLSVIASSSVSDVISVKMVTTAVDEADAIIFLVAPVVQQFIRMDFDASNESSVSYTSPTAVVSDYQDPTYSGTVSTSDNFALNIGKTRGIVFKLRLIANTGVPTNVKIEVFGKADFTERQYLAEYIDLTLGEYIDHGIWHFSNKEDLPNAYVVITSAISFTYTLVVELEALGNNA